MHHRNKQFTQANLPRTFSQSAANTFFREGSSFSTSLVQSAIQSLRQLNAFTFVRDHDAFAASNTPLVHRPSVPPMCREYVCSNCNTPDWDRCADASEAGLHGARCEFLQQTAQRYKCTICQRVDGVINKLEQLAFQEPWRLNDGPELQDWEKDGIVNYGTVIECDGEQSSQTCVTLRHTLTYHADWTSSSNNAPWDASTQRAGGGSS